MMRGRVMRKCAAAAVIFVVYACLYLLTILPRGGYFTLFGLEGFALSQFLGSILLFAVTLLLQRATKYRYRTWYFLIVALLPFVSEILIVICAAPYAAVPDTVFKMSAIIIAWYAGGFSRHRMLRVAVSAGFLATVVAMAFFGWDYWYNFVRYGSFSGRSSSSEKIELTVTDSNGDEVPLSSVSKGYVLLDFWSSSCGYCYKAMPEIERLHDKYKFTDKVGVYAVFCRFPSMGEMPLKGDSIVHGRGYTFPVLSVDYEGNKALMESHGVVRFPAYMIVDSTGTVVYKGALPPAERFLDGSLD